MTEKHTLKIYIFGGGKKYYKMGEGFNSSAASPKNFCQSPSIRCSGQLYQLYLLNMILSDGVRVFKPSTRRYRCVGDLKKKSDNNVQSDRATRIRSARPQLLRWKDTLLYNMSSYIALYSNTCVFNSVRQHALLRTASFNPRFDRNKVTPRTRIVRVACVVSTVKRTVSHRKRETHMWQ